MLTKPKAVLFDWDNTLVDSWDVISQALDLTLADMGIEKNSIPRSGRDAHVSMRDSFPKIFGDRAQEAAKRYMDHFSKFHLDLLLPIEYAQDLLDMLHADNEIYLAVVSNKTGSKLRDEIDHLDWNKYFTKIIGSTDLHEDKPSPNTVYHVLEGTNIKADHEVWFVGDTIIDMETAYNSGCLPILYGNTSHPDDEIYHNFKPKFHFENHQHSCDVVKKILA